MYSLFVGHLSEAELWPGPWVKHVGMQVGDLTMCEMDRQVGQTRTLDQEGSFFR